MFSGLYELLHEQVAGSASATAETPGHKASLRDRTCSTCVKTIPTSDIHRCKGCQIAVYCGRECQKADWERHKQVCSKATGFRSQWDEDHKVIFDHLLQQHPRASKSDLRQREHELARAWFDVHLLSIQKAVIAAIQEKTDSSNMRAFRHYNRCLFIMTIRPLQRHGRQPRDRVLRRERKPGPRHGSCVDEGARGDAAEVGRRRRAGVRGEAGGEPGRIWALPPRSVYEGLEEEVRALLERQPLSSVRPEERAKVGGKGKERARPVGDEMDIGDPPPCLILHVFKKSKSVYLRSESSITTSSSISLIAFPVTGDTPSPQTSSPTLPSPPSEMEAEFYYHGLPSAPRLVARSSTIPWKKPRSLEAYLQDKELRPVGNHAIEEVWEDKLAIELHALLDSMKVKWTSTDVVRIGIAEESSAPVILWVGVKPASLSGERGVNVASNSRHLLERYNLLLSQAGHSPDLNVNFREPLTPTLGIPICARPTPWAEGTGGIFIGEGGNNKRLFLLTARHVLFKPDQHNNQHFEHKNPN
ncbi:hypothetical protein EWM64_g5778 [Hericium alpestre]|uniref:MYND-type domain-containing protein n=1 Tax=Hericium alpestre TaxID=135208 RepID=A0A4Y9ZTK3_9AGAM|nr:hypothetical protein EWM64_g5778 [Hericium alpestre]